ncbi:hypothetical protein UF10_06245 [Peptostreptococcus russellii]|uniref:Chorismate mutase domain-containing protein n=1 Tax=Peptostreptococcus russellii TaxID=215200 RepID=A0A2P7PZV8_9FIRM|nr:chorismate mutase [Peptostreptococcus russellii]PSJ31235.1 hypothetical protein UF10_06245 [Peptostreptococcus russellii]
MDVLLKYRDEIDSIDKELIVLFEKRMDMACLVAEYKKEHGMDIFHPDREFDILKKCISDLNNKKYEEYAVEYIKKIMEISKKLQFDTIK